tara:strand:- start:1688 stop:2119 length:432 start_codon:yes stop_codon:yes gene_type:complete
MLTKKFFDRLGKKALKMYKYHIFDREIDVRGNKFRGYSAKYGALKKANKLKGQWAGSVNKKAPVVTQAFKNDLKLKGVKTNGFRLEWDGQGQKVNWLADRKRFVTTDRDPLPKDVGIEIDKQVIREIKRTLPKSKLHKIVLGK